VQRSDYQHLYKSKAWAEMRNEQLAREPWCVVCLACGRKRRAKVADHKVAHRGNLKLFWDAKNLQSLCTVHDGEKQSLERGRKPRSIIGRDGWPRPHPFDAIGEGNGRR
jgi:5-methylcytosine-specific restriction endonuclease McrA